jgi:hypothetical protein
MSLMRWAKLLVVSGLLLLAGGALPALLLMVLPPGFAQGFFALVAFLLSVSLAPFGAVVAVTGAIMAGLAALRRGGA